MARSGSLADHGPIGQLRSLLVFSFKQQLPDLGQGGRCFGVIIVGRTPRPHTFFIELNALFIDIAKNHQAQRTIPQWQGFQPFGIILPASGIVGNRSIGWLIVPQFEIRLFRVSVNRLARPQQKGCNWYEESSVKFHSLVY